MTGRNSDRSLANSNPVRVRFDTFELDEANARLLREGKAVALAPTPFAVLCTLVRQQGSLLTKNALLDEVWGHQFVSDSVLKTAISDLRTVLDDDPRQPRFIETVSRKGYRFIASTVTAAPPAKERGARDLQKQAFVGRTEALRRLHSAWERACNGQRAVVWVAGEPGIGKTTLIDHFTAGLGDIAYARGQCVEHHGPGEPYLPVLEALAELCRSDNAAAPLLRAVAPTWLLQLPWLSTADERDALQRELAGVGPDRMMREIGELLDRYTERRPLLLVTEDLHWSDRATIQLIDYIARRRGSAQLMWLSSFRLAEVVALDHPLNSARHELRLHGLCDEIVLDAFSEREVADYVAGHAPRLAGHEAFVRTLHERTDGVPLFVASLVTDAVMRTSDSDHGDAQGILANVAVPQNLAGIIDHYIAKLGNEERALLSAAAVCGVEFRVNTIADVVGRDATSVAEMCDQLVREQLWLTTPRPRDESIAPELPYSFRHALFRQVLYERTPPSMRTQLHRKVGVALERERAAGLPVAATELALHFERCSALIMALRYYAEAAESALLRFSPSQTMSLTAHAMTLVPLAADSHERTTLEISLATLQGAAAVEVFGTSSAEAKRAYQRAFSLIDSAPLHPMRGLFLHGLGLVLWTRGELDEANTLAERCDALFAATADQTVLLCGCLVHGMVEHARGRPRLSRRWLEKSIDEAKSLDESPSRALFAAADPTVLALSLLAIELLYLGLFKQGRARLCEAHERADALHQPGPQLAVLWFEAEFELHMGNAERVADVSEQLITLVGESAPWPQGRAAHAWLRGWAKAQLEDPRAGYRLIKDGYEQAVRLGMRLWGSQTLGYAAGALGLAGDWTGAQRELDEAMRCAEAVGERLYRPQLLLLDARIADALGESDRARESVRQALAESRTQEAPWLELLALSELCGRDDANAKDRQALEALVDQLPEASDTNAVKNARALVSRRKPFRKQRATVN